MKHTDLFYKTPKNESTEADKEAAKELDIPAEAMTYILEVWERNCFRVLWPESFDND